MQLKFYIAISVVSRNTTQLKLVQLNSKQI